MNHEPGWGEHHQIARQPTTRAGAAPRGEVGEDADRLTLNPQPHHSHPQPPTPQRRDDIRRQHATAAADADAYGGDDGGDGQWGHDMFRGRARGPAPLAAPAAAPLPPLSGAALPPLFTGTTVMVANLPRDLGSDDVMDVFQRFAQGQVKSIAMH